MRGSRGGFLTLVVGLAAVALFGAQGGASSTPQGISLEPIGAFTDPTFVTGPPGDPTRLFVVEQTGQIKLILDGGEPTTFLDATTWISDGGERGLLSMAFAPDYATSRRFYIYFTDPGGSIEVDEVLRDMVDPNVADPNTRRQVIVIPHPNYSNHNGGQLEFVAARSCHRPKGERRSAVHDPG